MTTVTLILLAFGLAMDAFAVSVTNGMCYRRHPIRNALSSGLAFGIFQALMPLLGLLAGYAFSGVMDRLNHWIALVLLSLIGGGMIRGVISDRKDAQDAPQEKSFTLKTLLIQAVATSIDALAVGVGLGVLGVNILFTVGMIGLITFGCSFTGVLIGHSVGSLLKDKAGILGGLILIGIGIKIFLEHTILR